MTHPAELEQEKLLAECDVRRTRRSGPGGQHRNKVETAVVITHRPTGFTAEANERRSQADNRRVAIARLRLRLALGCRTARGIKYQPSETWNRHQTGSRLTVSPANERFPMLLAEALDVLQNCQWDIANAAELLNISSSQLIKFLKREPLAFSMVNQQRAGLGRHKLK